jgi:hypothetical protein
MNIFYGAILGLLLFAQGIGGTAGVGGTAGFGGGVSSSVIVNTVFNETGSGTNLAGTTPATCTNGCVPPWTLSCGTDWTYQVGGGISSSTANTCYDTIGLGTTTYVLSFTIGTIPASGTLLQFALRFTASNAFIAFNICPSTASGCGTGISVFDVTPSGVTQIGSTVSGTYAGNYTITLSGTSFSATTPSGPIPATGSGTTANTSGTTLEFSLMTAVSGAVTITALQVQP